MAIWFEFWQLTSPEHCMATSELARAQNRLDCVFAVVVCVQALDLFGSSETERIYYIIEERRRRLCTATRAKQYASPD